MIGGQDVASDLFHRVVRGQQTYILPSPQPKHPALAAVRRREQHVGIQEDAIQASYSGGLLMDDLARIQSHPPDLLHGFSVVLRIHGIGEKELGFSFG